MKAKKSTLTKESKDPKKLKSSKKASLSPTKPRSPKKSKKPKEQADSKKTSPASKKPEPAKKPILKTKADSKKVISYKSPKTSKADVLSKPVKSSITADKAQTMDELLAATGHVLKGLKRGDTVEGTITYKDKKVIYVDVNAKTEGMILDKEINLAQELVADLDVGDKITVYVAQPENDKGQILLSLKKAFWDYKWQSLQDKFESGEPIEVRGKEVNKGGLVADAGGVMGFVPSSQFGRKFEGSLHELINRTLKAKIIELNRESNRLILSEKAVSEAEVEEKKTKLLEQIKTGQSYKAKVVGVVPFGAFMRVTAGDEKDEFLEGLVHISEISWQKVERVEDFVKQGEECQVKVIGVDNNSGKLQLSLKQLKSDPWDDVESRYKIEDRVKGTVSRLAPFGAFVELEPGVQGLLHISKIPADVQLKVGEKIDCYLESLEPSNRRMSLGMVLKQVSVTYK